MDYTEWSRNTKVLEFTASEKYYEQLAIEFLNKARDATAEKGNFLAVLGGGNTPRKINEKIVELSGKYEVDWSRVYIVLSDERWVEENSDYSNSRMMRQTLIEPLHRNALFQLYESSKKVEGASRSYAHYILDLLERTGQKTFDYALLGVGSDGHTASLFPGNHFLPDRGPVAVCGGKGPEGLERISLSYAALNRCSLISFLINSPEKRAIYHLMNVDWNPGKYPIQNINSIKNMYILAD